MIAVFILIALVLLALAVVSIDANSQFLFRAVVTVAANFDSEMFVSDC